MGLHSVTALHMVPPCSVMKFQTLSSMRKKMDSIYRTLVHRQNGQLTSGNIFRVICRVDAGVNYEQHILPTPAGDLPMSTDLIEQPVRKDPGLLRVCVWKVAIRAGNVDQLKHLHEEAKPPRGFTRHSPYTWQPHSWTVAIIPAAASPRRFPYPAMDAFSAVIIMTSATQCWTLP